MALKGEHRTCDAVPRFNFDDIPDDNTCIENFRFDKAGLMCLAAELHLPDTIRCPQRTTVGKMEALCIFLRRLSYPNCLPDLVPQFGRSEAELSYIIKEVTGILYDRHCAQLQNLVWLDEQHCQAFANAIHEGVPVDRCWGFIDGTTIRIARPKYLNDMCSADTRGTSASSSRV